MLLTPQAAQLVCNQLASLGELVGRIEGGIWSDDRFEARLDCIWDAPDSRRIDVEGVAALAIEFIREKMVEHNAFIVTGW